jgi:hypothetical protein
VERGELRSRPRIGAASGPHRGRIGVVLGVLGIVVVLGGGGVAVARASLPAPATVESVVGERLNAPSVTATTSSGEVVLDFARGPDRVEVRAGSGDVEASSGDVDARSR